MNGKMLNDARQCDMTGKYLQQYAHTDGWELTANSGGVVDNVVVIPALAELKYLFRTLAALSRNDRPDLEKTLVICVVNNKPVDDSGKAAFVDNQETLDILRHLVEGKGIPPWVSEPSQKSWLDEILSSNLRTGYVDASSKGRELPRRTGGVGLARKIGFDLALESLGSPDDGWDTVFCWLDADSLVEPNYLDAVRRHVKTHRFPASVIRYAHGASRDPLRQQAIICYELFLRYYVWGLSFAGSPYAFHTIGSTIAGTAEGYAAVRGISIKTAGEDFYFLNKIAKTGRVGRVTATTVHPSSRASARVPFGTGRKIAGFTEEMKTHYPAYDPDAFSILGEWLRTVHDCCDDGAEELINRAANIHPSLAIFLRIDRFDHVWPRLVRNSRSEKSLRRHFTAWFDGLRTFRLIRHLTKHDLPPVGLFSAIGKLADMTGTELPETNEQSPAAGQMKLLERLREIEP